MKSGGVPDFLLDPNETEALTDFLHGTIPTIPFETLAQELVALEDAYQAIFANPDITAKGGWQTWYSDPQVQAYMAQLAHMKQQAPGFTVERVETEHGMIHALIPAKRP